MTTTGNPTPTDARIAELQALARELLDQVKHDYLDSEIAEVEAIINRPNP